MVPSGVLATTPMTRPQSRMRSTASCRIRRSKEGKLRARAERKFRKSHCGISATNLQCAGTRLKFEVSEDAADGRQPLVRHLEEVLEKPELIHQLECRRMDGVTAKIAEEIV